MTTIKEGEALIKHLKRIEPDGLSDAELAAFVALVLARTPRLLDEGTDDERCEIPAEDGAWRVFDPVNDWNDFAELIDGEEVVLGSHRRYAEDGSQAGMWYSAHAFLSGTSVESLESMQEAGCLAAARLAKIRLGYQAVAHHVPD